MLQDATSQVHTHTNIHTHTERCHALWSVFGPTAGEKQGPLMKKKRQSESDVFRERWFVVKNGVLSYYRDKKVRPATHNVNT